jgi:hypothetical protein
LLEFVNHSSNCDDVTGYGVGVGVGEGDGVGVDVGVEVGVGDGVEVGVAIDVFASAAFDAVTVLACTSRGVGVDVGMSVDWSGCGEINVNMMANGAMIRPIYIKTCFTASSIRIHSISEFSGNAKSST